MIRKKVKLTAEGNCIVIKPYTVSELASMYDVDKRTFRNWLAPFKKELGKRSGRYYNIPQVKLIFKKLDYPTVAALEDKTDNTGQ